MTKLFSLRFRDGDDTVFDVHVPPDLWAFEGHFEGSPILAAVVQLDALVVAPARTLWPSLQGVKRCQKLRFRSPVRPGDDLVVRLCRPAPGQLTFEIRRRGSVCSSGTLGFDETPPA